jgi:hypothetical protein
MLRAASDGTAASVPRSRRDPGYVFQEQEQEDGASGDGEDCEDDDHADHRYEDVDDWQMDDELHDGDIDRDLDNPGSYDNADWPPEQVPGVSEQAGGSLVRVCLWVENVSRCCRWEPCRFGHRGGTDKRTGVGVTDTSRERLFTYIQDIYMYIYMYTYILCICIYIHTYYIYIYTHTHTHAYIYTHKHTHTQTHTHTHTHTRVYIYIYIYIYICIHIHIYIFIIHVLEAYQSCRIQYLEPLCMYGFTLHTHIHIQEGLPELIFTEGCDEDGVDLGPCISLQRCSNGRLSTNGSAAGGVDAVRVMLLGVTDAGRSPF